MLTKQRRLGAKHLVLPASLLVVVVHDQDSHRQRSSKTGIAPTATRSPASNALVVPVSVLTRRTRQAEGTANSLLAFGFQTIHASLPPSRVTWQVHSAPGPDWHSRTSAPVSHSCTLW